jgi:hypothetical protein
MLRPHQRALIVGMRFPFQTAVVGTSFRPEAAASVSVGAPALLRREPENPHDAAAVAVDIDGTHVGYLPRALSARLEGDRWEGVVTDVFRRDGVGLRIRVTGQQASPRRTVGPVVASTARAVNPVTPPPTDVLVRARSGRELGLLIRRDALRVKVRTRDGRVVSYPADLVETQQVEPA